MSEGDDKERPSGGQQPPESAAAPPAPVPEPFHVPEDAIQHWLTFPENEPLQTTLTRADVDNLFFALAKSYDSQHFLQEGLVKWTNSDVAGANIDLANARRTLQEANNHARRFLTGIMRGTKK
jgi:hypothetical protein